MATLPSVQNSVELENELLDALRERAIAAGFEYPVDAHRGARAGDGPEWLRGAAVLERVDNYLRSGSAYVYVQADLKPRSASESQAGS